VLSDELSSAAAVATRSRARLAQQQCALYCREYDGDDQHEADGPADDVRRYDDYFTQAVHVRLRQVNADRPSRYTHTRQTDTRLMVPLPGQPG